MSKSMVIVAVDPGRTTGMIWTAGDLSSFEAVEAYTLSEVWEQLARWQPDVIVCEDYFGGLSRNWKDPVEAIGVVKAYAQMYGIPCIMQSPAVQARWKRELADAHRSRHVRSALAHAKHYLQCPSRRSR